jgi:hypothetical protein
MYWSIETLPNLTDSQRTCCHCRQNVRALKFSMLSDGVCLSREGNGQFVDIRLSDPRNQEVGTWPPCFVHSLDNKLDGGQRPKFCRFVSCGRGNAALPTRSYRVDCRSVSDASSAAWRRYQRESRRELKRSADASTNANRPVTEPGRVRLTRGASCGGHYAQRHRVGDSRASHLFSCRAGVTLKPALKRVV